MRTNMDRLSAGEELQRFLAGAGGWRVTLAHTGPFHCLSQALELEVESNKLVLTIRQPDRVWTRRILSYEFVDDRTLRLLLGRRGRGDPLSAMIVAEPSAVTTVERRAHRRAFTHAFKAALGRAFPGARFLALRRNPPFSPLYLCRAMQWQGRLIAVTGLV